MEARWSVVEVCSDGVISKLYGQSMLLRVFVCASFVTLVVAACRRMYKWEMCISDVCFAGTTSVDCKCRGSVWAVGANRSELARRCRQCHARLKA